MKWKKFIALGLTAGIIMTNYLSVEATNMENNENKVTKPVAKKIVQTAGHDVLGDFAPDFARYNDDILFGEVWSRNDKLSLHDRKILHEVLGVLMLVAAVFHLIWNRQCFSSLLRGKWTFRRCLSAGINWLLIVNVLIIMATGMMISNHLFKGVFGIYLQRNIMVHQLHVSLPYLLLILLGLHLGLHWSSLWQRFTNWSCWNLQSLKYRIGCYFMMFFLIAGGVYGSFMHQVGDRLRLKHLFITAATQAPFGIFILTLLNIIGMYAVVSFMVQRSTRNSRDKCVDNEFEGEFCSKERGV
ncbi:DUF4405 domain-containing protein [Sporomusa acidovorans]|uniref:DUF4405 domain-containing protein n=2 Tax=Sporomusa TaxID=2375 RepID=A0ABZ3J285_SPOA4|nr:DUF4405 domain-containing protein [Sporomusa acidovorans]OZC24156.1 hypothetical protein SPACI_01920 [Sporomusa acidovorans DSM 3132]SDF37526.1 protein of unknown function [Sporomusa acidovorans]